MGGEGGCSVEGSWGARTLMYVPQEYIVSTSIFTRIRGWRVWGEHCKCWSIQHSTSTDIAVPPSIVQCGIIMSYGHSKFQFKNSQLSTFSYEIYKLTENPQHSNRVARIHGKSNSIAFCNLKLCNSKMPNLENFWNLLSVHTKPRGGATHRDFQLVVNWLKEREKKEEETADVGHQR